MTIRAGRDAASERPAVSVVVPTYRGEGSLEELVVRVSRVLGARGDTFEILVVDDASPDGSWYLLERLAARHPQLRAISLLGNRGQYQATVCGIAHARGLTVVTIDDDLEHPPEDVATLLDALDADQDLDAVVGTWPLDRALVRNLGTRAHRWVNHVAYGSPKGFHHTGFRAIRRPVAEAMAEHRTRNPVISASLWQTTKRIANVPVGHDPGPQAISGFRVRAGVRTVLRNLIRTSTAPLRLLAVLGCAAAVLALLAALYVLGRWLFGIEPPPGWASVFLATLFFGGSILVGIGLLGEYIALIVSETQGRPRWSIRSELSHESVTRDAQGAADGVSELPGAGERG